MQRLLQRAFWVLITASALFVTPSLPAQAVSSQTWRAIGKHHFGSNPHHAAIVLGASGAFSPTTIKILNDAEVLQTQPASPPGSEPVGLSGHTLPSLLKLAEAEGFFSMPYYRGCPTPPGVPEGDVGTRSIQIFTTTGSKQVSVQGGCLLSFDELYDLLSSVVKSVLNNPPQSQSTVVSARGNSATPPARLRASGGRRATYIPLHGPYVRAPARPAGAGSGQHCHDGTSSRQSHDFATMQPGIAID